MERFEPTTNACLAYRDVGRGTPIICIHGWGASGAFFEPQIQSLATDHRLIVPDLRGHGRSSPFHEGLEFATLADDVHALMEHLDLRGAIVVGWSMGALLAWDLASRLGTGRLAGLVSVDMVPRLLNDAEWAFGLREGEDGQVFSRSVARMKADWAAFTGVFIPRIFAANGTPSDAARIETAREIAARNDPDSMARLWMTMVEQDLRGAMSAIDVPTLVMYGEKSRLYPGEASQWLVHALPGGRSVAFEESGHTPHLEEPERFNAVLKAFVSEAVARPEPDQPVPAGQNPR